MEQSNGTNDPRERAGELVTRLATHRGRPCLALLAPTIDQAALLATLDAVGEYASAPEMDVIVASHGGSIDESYQIVRTLRRRFARMTAFVPACAKSAATLICLAADEIVMGELGQLGPLDAQSHQGNASALEPFKAFEQVSEMAKSVLERSIRVATTDCTPRLLDSTCVAVKGTGQILGALFAPLDPVKVADSARALEYGAELAARVLRRYRPALWENGGEGLVHRLVHHYPGHGFPIDYEECVELGLPVRPPDEKEDEILCRLAQLLFAHDENIPLIRTSLPDARAETKKGNGAAMSPPQKNDTKPLQPAAS